jgi:predicted ABC-type ATPase
MATMYIIAGCNGSGKTTTANTLLEEYFGCYEFINADLIEGGKKIDYSINNDEIYDKIRRQYNDFKGTL